MSTPDEFDSLAGEYVLGTLSQAERADVEARRSADPAMAEAIIAWEERLGPLLEAAPEVAPPPVVYDNIAARLFGRQLRPDLQSAPPEHLLLRRSVRRWQTAFAGALALAAALAVWIVAVPAPTSEHQFVAVLQKEAGSTAVVLDIDTETRKLTIRPVAASSPSGRSLELWLIPGSGAPRSLGTVSPTGITRASLTGFDPQTIEGATYAVTLEPAGGSPTGAPSGPPIVSGRGSVETH